MFKSNQPFNRFISMYAVLTQQQLDQLKRDGYLEFHDDDIDEKPINDWMFEQMQKRIATSNHRDIPSKYLGPHWLFCDKSDINKTYSRGKYIITLDITPNNFILFNDHDYCMVANDLMSGVYHTYIAYTEEEASVTNRTQDEITASWERMFEVCAYPYKPDPSFYGSISYRAITPFISIKSILSTEYITP